MSAIPEATVREIANYQTKLEDLLSRKFADHSLLLGLNLSIQAKFQLWILNDSKKYYALTESASTPPNNQHEAAFNTITYFEMLWSQFHYPMVKFYQRQHAMLHGSTVEEFNKFASGKDNKAKLKFKVKPVETRKLHECFVKFLKQTDQFYDHLLKHFSTQYKNPLIPSKFLQAYGIEVPADASALTIPNVQANFVFLVHRCLLTLGNLSRQRSFTELTYVNPCLSNSNFWKYKNLSGLTRVALMRPMYKAAFEYYENCILLLPALNEPYNHIGMMLNSIGLKFDAVYWFLRSEFTRIPDYKLGVLNLDTVLKKKLSITDDLLEFYKGEKTQITAHTSNSMLLCLIGYFYLPGVYQLGPNIIRKIKYTQVEKDFYGSMDIKSDSRIDTHLQQFIVVVSFLGLMELKAKHSAEKNAMFRYSRFVMNHLTHLFNYLTSISHTNTKKAVIVTRVVLNWLDSRSYKMKKATGNALIVLVDALLKEVHHPHKLLDTFNSGSRPTRSYYFDEDVLFKDFLLVNYQFKDFKDDHLFESGNIDLLVGDYSCYCHGKTPSFLDNEAAGRISTDDDVKAEIEHYEVELRLHAVAVLAMKVLKARHVEFVLGETLGLKRTTMVEVDDSQKPKKTKEKKQKSKKSEQKQKATQVIEQEQESESEQESEQDFSSESDSELSDSDLNEIESFIREHTSKLHSMEEPQVPQPQAHREPVVSPATQNIWSTQSEQAPFNPFQGYAQIYGTLPQQNMPYGYR